MGQWFNRPGSNLATVARDTGYPVVEVPGWTTRGHGPLGNHVGVVVAHHTAGPEPEQTSSNYPSLDVVTHGRPGLPGPLSHFGIGYDGTVYVIAAGLAYHAGRGGWAGFSGNSTALGIEAEDSGDGDWTPQQLDVYPRLVARTCRFLGISAAGVCAHREWAPNRKIDPAGIDMDAFRRRVADYLAHPETIPKEDDVSADEVWNKELLLWHASNPDRETMPAWQQLHQARAYSMLAFHRSQATLDAVNRFPQMLEAAGHTDPQAVAEALRPVIAEAVGPVIEGAVADALGQDNAATAETIVDRIAQRLAGEQTSGA
ncbi:N-acetylmuramoyl-L-alanine amidase [Halopolyspora algeriensis]|uniref:N-acetylmuramoyl-L-alanine amidase n=1 Tax=Halopolyspora algeriensis TaxID=1500506 RepID=A0A368VIG3_9ACTN|nr:N-acetylmuramoyl-L-alanine amidase [Halopolyspora algeriensis]RCW39989.1 N-acetylmuramoyl-L-alanine amidase [Halopolyspora algeriensis]TQM46574.1 N-acetylmuramoyl-L-alanine amidase [Halopolyspora algeriensis]